MKALSLKEIKRIGHNLSPTVHVGKEGVTDGVVEELKKQIEENEVVKVKILSTSAVDRGEAGHELAERSSSTLIEVRGRTALLCKYKVYSEGDSSAEGG